MGTRLARDPHTAVGPFTDVLSAADIAIGNLETALGTGGTPENKDFTFQAPASAVDALRAGGFDAVSMANNHGRDFGPDGLEESLAIKEAQPDHFIIGIGRNEAEAYAPFTTTVRGQRIAVIGATQVLDGELVESWTATPNHPGLASAKRVDALVAAVQQARANAETVVVFLHWGIERNDCPSDVQTTLARQLVDAGADIVIGGHAHRVQGAGMLGNAFVGYGLGNFDFTAVGAGSERTGVVQVTVTGRHVDKYEYIPGTVRGAVATPLTDDSAQAALDYWVGLRTCTGLTA
jgi:poly-gamma-glutamate synthesis protein (capsule biosynthesis protein)